MLKKIKQFFCRHRYGVLMNSKYFYSDFIEEIKLNEECRGAYFYCLKCTNKAYGKRRKTWYGEVVE